MSVSFSCIDPIRTGPHGGPEIADQPEPLNLSNDRALALLRLMGLPAQLEGTLDVSSIPAARQRLLVALNSQKARGLESTPPSDSGATSGPRFIEQGMADEYLARKAENLLGFLAHAHSLQQAVAWS